MKVRVERYIEQVQYGSQYKGYLKIVDTNFDYDLNFAVLIPSLDGIGPFNGIGEIRRIFQFTLRKDGLNVDLTDKEFGFLFPLIMELVAEIYSHPQNRAGDKGFIGAALRGNGVMAKSGISAFISTDSINIYDFPPELCDMLNSEKFGWPLGLCQ